MRSAKRAILWGWLLCGVLDIASAIVIALANNGSPVRMLQGIAGAVLGPAALQGGLATAALGLAMHFGVALAAAAIYYGLSRRIPAMTAWAVPSGIVYGVVWLLSCTRRHPILAALRPLYLTTSSSGPATPLAASFFVHIVCVGLPIAFAVRRFGPLSSRSAAP